MSRKSKFKRICDCLDQVARPVILRDFREDSCIASTQTVIRVLDHFGYVAKPQPVVCHIFNPIWVQLGIGSLSEADVRNYEAAGARMVTLGEPPDKITPIVGHVIALVPEFTTLIDASLSQANRPMKGIHLPPILIADSTSRMYTINRSLLVYVYTEHWKFLQESNDWKLDSRTDHPVKTLVEYIEPRL